MSIEQTIAAQTAALQENTAAIIALTEVLKTAEFAPQELAQPGVAQNTGSRKRKTAKAASSASEISETAPASTVQPAPALETVAAVEPVAENVTQEQIDPLAEKQDTIDLRPSTYKQASDAVVNLANAKGRAAAIAILESFGVAKLPEAKPEQYADIIAACEEALA